MTAGTQGRLAEPTSQRPASAGPLLQPSRSPLPSTAHPEDGSLPLPCPWHCRAKQVSGTGNKDPWEEVARSISLVPWESCGVPAGAYSSHQNVVPHLQVPICQVPPSFCIYFTALNSCMLCAPCARLVPADVRSMCQIPFHLEVEMAGATEWVLGQNKDSSVPPPRPPPFGDRVSCRDLGWPVL